mmetsp:Transcript_1666/g.4288  ORF Transcript_1666/g.4288 Transcript_1666/m.4288 type:complete len:418 (-) Transcript_1666:25-1278(-)
MRCTNCSLLGWRGRQRALCQVGEAAAGNDDRGQAGGHGTADVREDGRDHDDDRAAQTSGDGLHDRVRVLQQARHQQADEGLQADGEPSVAVEAGEERACEPARVRGSQEHDRAGNAEAVEHHVLHVDVKGLVLFQRKLVGDGAGSVAQGHEQHPHEHPGELARGPRREHLVDDKTEEDDEDTSQPSPAKLNTEHAPPHGSGPEDHGVAEHAERRHVVFADGHEHENVVRGEDGCRHGQPLGVRETQLSRDQCFTIGLHRNEVDEHGDPELHRLRQEHGADGVERVTAAVSVIVPSLLLHRDGDVDGHGEADVDRAHQVRQHLCGHHGPDEAAHSEGCHAAGEDDRQRDEAADGTLERNLLAGGVRRETLATAGGLQLRADIEHLHLQGGGGVQGEQRRQRGQDARHRGRWGKICGEK